MVTTVRGHNHQRRVESVPAEKNGSQAPHVHGREAPRIDTVEGGGTSATTTMSAGSRTALIGLSAAQPKKQGFQWRSAVATALLGISLLGGGLAPTAKANAMTMPAQQRTELVLPFTTGPPPITFTVHAKPPLHVDADTVPVVDTRPHQGLPDILATLTTGVTVVHGTDPGDFYCEHAFYTTTAEARAPGSSVLRDAQGEVLTGFLHNPSDSFTYDATLKPVQSERHAERAQVVGAAIRGFFEASRDQIGDKPFKMLLTGYGAWGGVVNNPTGDFVIHKENVDSAMKFAFGAALMTEHGKQHGTELRYRVLDQATGKARTIVVDAVQLPVSDAAINGSPDSLQALMHHFKPHAVLSMGVAGGSSAFQAEFHADDGGLAIKDGKPVHDDGKSPGNNQPDNFSLARAIARGHRLMNPHEDVAPTDTVAIAAGDP